MIIEISSDLTFRIAAGPYLTKEEAEIDLGNILCELE